MKVNPLRELAESPGRTWQSSTKAKSGEVSPTEVIQGHSHSLETNLADSAITGLSEILYILVSCLHILYALKILVHLLFFLPLCFTTPLR